MKVLIAEDDQVSQRVLQKHLETWGHQVQVADDGQQAWELYQQQDFSMLISDWNMPGVDGIELLNKIRARDDLGYVYIILLTARTDKADLVVGMQAGADDFLHKPFDRNELRARVRAGERIIELQTTLQQQNQLLRQVNTRMQQDLAAAAKVQQSLLPGEMPESRHARFAWSFRPCDQLAGDNLNVFQLDSKHVGLYVADVSGHGIAASLLSVTISRVLSPDPGEGLLVQQDDPASDRKVIAPAVVAQELNRRFPMEDFGGKYFTIVYGVLNTETFEFRYVSAAHPPILLLSRDHLPRLLEANSPAIGWLPDTQYEEKRVQLKMGDRLCIYTDGIPEARNVELEEFGNNRMLESFTCAPTSTLEDCVNDMMLKIETWCGAAGLKDDVTMIAIEITD